MKKNPLLLLRQVRRRLAFRETKPRGCQKRAQMTKKLANPKVGGSAGPPPLSGGEKHDCSILSETDNVVSKKLKKAYQVTAGALPSAASAPPAPAPPRYAAAGGGAGDFSAARLYAKEKSEKSGADLARIIKLKADLEMEYVKALCTAYVDKMERD